MTVDGFLFSIAKVLGNGHCMALGTGMSFGRTARALAPADVLSTCNRAGILKGAIPHNESDIYIQTSSNSFSGRSECLGNSENEAHSHGRMCWSGISRLHEKLSYSKRRI